MTIFQKKKQILEFQFVVSLLVLISCSSKFDGKNGTKTTYFDGTEKIRQLIEYKDGKKNGTFTEFYPNGNVHIRQHYLNDMLEDTSFIFYEDGQTASFQIKKNNRKEGCWKNFSKYGHIISEVNFENDKLNGQKTSYTYKSGRVLERLNFKNGEKDGKQECFYNNGKYKCITYFNHGELCLGTEEWLENGEKINNDFKIIIEEQNKVLMVNIYRYYIRLENPQDDDKVYLLGNNDTLRNVTTVASLNHSKDRFIYEIKIAKGGFVMETLKFGAFRNTKMGNMIIKTISINASINNF